MDLFRRSLQTSRVTKRESSLLLTEREVKDQLVELPRFASEVSQLDIGRGLDPSEMIFTGSGDSFAASLFGHYYSSGVAEAWDPFELAEVPKVARKKTVFITSVSGRTKANLVLAKKVNHVTRRRIAITADPASPLAKSCDNLIQLPYLKKSEITPGTLTFTLSLLAVASRIKRLPNLKELSPVNARANEWAKQQSISKRGAFLFIGSGVAFALSAYGAFKIHEVLGRPADYIQTEQLGHSKLFSVMKTDNIIGLVSKRDPRTGKVLRTLEKNGFSASQLRLNSPDSVVSAIEAAFSFQHLALRLAQERRLQDVAFLADKQTLALSSRLIY